MTGSVPLREGWVPCTGSSCIGTDEGALDRTFVEFARSMMY
jgi:hypothetical protein